MMLFMLINLRSTFGREEVYFDPSFRSSCLFIVQLRVQRKRRTCIYRATGAIAARFRGPQVTCMVEAPNEPLTEVPHPVILRGGKLDSDHSNAGLSSETAEEDDAITVSCSYLCSKNKDTSSFTSVEGNADKIQVSILLNRSVKSPKSAAPIAEYFRALKEAKLLVEDYNLQVTRSLLCREGSFTGEVDARRSIHLRLGLPFDRPLLLMTLLV